MSSRRIDAGEPVDLEAGTASGRDGPRAEPPAVVTVGTHDGVRALLADPRLHADFHDRLAESGVRSGAFHAWASSSPLLRGGPEHARWRDAVARALTARLVDRVRPFLRATAHALADAFVAAGRCELMAAFAEPYSALALCEVLGIPAGDRDRFRGWAEVVGAAADPGTLAVHVDRVDPAMEALLAYATALAAARRAAPCDDLVGRIVHVGGETGWSDADVGGTVAALVFAGYETTARQLGWMVAALSERLDLWDAVAERSIAPGAVVEETLRYRPASSTVGRTVAAPLDHEGQRLDGGDRVLLSLAVAGADPNVYPEPEGLAPQHNGHLPHFAFGHGAHHCLGAALARAALQEALAVLTARIRCPALAPDAVWKAPVGITGPERLPITFTARAQATSSR